MVDVSLLVESADGSKLGQDLDGIKVNRARFEKPERKTHMKGIKITIQSVQRGLRVCSLFLDDSIRLTFGWLVRSRSWPSVCLISQESERATESISEISHENVPGSSLPYLCPHVGRRTHQTLG